MDAETPIEKEDAAVAPEDDQCIPNPRSQEARGTSNLRSAVRAARIEDAERSRAIADLRGAELARLDLLREAIEPVLAQVPADIEMFDAGLIPVPQPRLFIDMIAFVEMAHDKRRYRFVQDTRQGRVVLAESERLEVLRDAVTAYIARRLVEREKALAGEVVLPPPKAEVKPLAPRDPVAWPPRRRRRRGGWLRAILAIMLNYLGIVALCVLVWVVGRAIFDTVTR